MINFHVYQKVVQLVKIILGIVQVDIRDEI